MMIDVETAKGYMKDLANDSHWLTDYAQDILGEGGQRLINITITMNRAKWLIAELLGELKVIREEDSDADVERTSGAK